MPEVVGPAEAEVECCVEAEAEVDAVDEAFDVEVDADGAVSSCVTSSSSSSAKNSYSSSSSLSIKPGASVSLLTAAAAVSDVDVPTRAVCVDEPQVTLGWNALSSAVHALIRSLRSRTAARGLNTYADTALHNSRMQSSSRWFIWDRILNTFCDCNCG